MLVENASGREIEITVCGSNHDDIEISSAVYVDNGEEATDADVEYIYQEYTDSLYEEWLQRAIMQAEYTYEEDR